MISKPQILRKRKSERGIFPSLLSEVVALADKLHINRSKVKEGEAKPIRCVDIGLGRYLLYEEQGKTMHEEQSLKA